MKQIWPVWEKAIYDSIGFLWSFLVTLADVKWRLLILLEIFVINFKLGFCFRRPWNYEAKEKSVKFALMALSARRTVAERIAGGFRLSICSTLRVVYDRSHNPSEVENLSNWFSRKQLVLLYRSTPWRFLWQKANNRIAVSKLASILCEGGPYPSKTIFVLIFLAIIINTILQVFTAYISSRRVRDRKLIRKRICLNIIHARFIDSTLDLSSVSSSLHVCS